MRIGGRSTGQESRRRVAQQAKAPHQMIEVKISFESSTQFFVEVPRPLSAGKILID